MGKYEYIGKFSDGLFVAKSYGKWGYIDEYGKVVIPFIYDSAENFSEGYARVMLDGSVMFIDKNGHKFEKIDAETFDYLKELEKTKNLYTSLLKRATKKEEVSALVRDYVTAVKYLKDKRDEMISGIIFDENSFQNLQKLKNEKMEYIKKDEPFDEMNK